MKQYYNFKNLYSVVLLALVDVHYRFIWASIGAPGNTHKSIYFQTISFWEKITTGEIIAIKLQTIDGIEIPPQILGDGFSHYVLYQTKDISTTVLVRKFKTRRNNICLIPLLDARSFSRWYTF